MDKGNGAAQKDRQFIAALAKELVVLQCFTPEQSELGSSEPGLFIQIDGGRLRAPESAVESSCYTKIRQQLR
ncbi:hypothetical protein, partial [Celeribacter indicus]|uniref:hypothetical protein n=1 Tax=Celeribacter indicus TaxID=1208324 RepID=UPI000897229C